MIDDSSEFDDRSLNLVQSRQNLGQPAQDEDTRWIEATRRANGG
jgi:hypothetical protein